VSKKNFLRVLVFVLVAAIVVGCSEKKSQIKIEKVLLFGDSLMSGYGLPEDDHLSVVLEKSLKSDKYEIQIFNGSISGDTSSDGLDRIENELSDTSYDLIIIGLGANDMLRRINPDQTKQNLEDIINIITSNNIKIILAGMIASPTNGLNYKKKFDKIYPDLSKKFELELIPFLLKGVALNPSLNQADGIHPNEKGVLIIAETIKKSITNFLKK
jgi:acyl-CoA thioesterase-1|tara:strand:- start:126 stop:767 length:642 start_codon:yes stop_codon:yes gene_type:complete